MVCSFFCGEVFERLFMKKNLFLLLIIVGVAAATELGDAQNPEDRINQLAVQWCNKTPGKIAERAFAVGGAGLLLSGGWGLFCGLCALAMPVACGVASDPNLVCKPLCFIPGSVITSIGLCQGAAGVWAISKYRSRKQKRIEIERYFIKEVQKVLSDNPKLNKLFLTADAERLLSVVEDAA